MTFSEPLVAGTLIRRYKRFLADVCLDDGETVTAHCANPGSMMGLCAPGTRVWLEPNEDPGRKLKFSWRLVDLPDGARAGVDTAVPNRVVAEALASGLIPDLAVYPTVRPEVRYGRGSRIDFLLSGARRPDAYVEVKNVHLCRTPGLAEFPDSVTSRGARHLDELADMVRAGYRAVMFYCVQRDDCTRLALAGDIDPVYAASFARARATGVEAIAWRCRIDTREIALDRPIPIAET